MQVSEKQQSNAVLLDNSLLMNMDSVEYIDLAVCAIQIFF